MQLNDFLGAPSSRLTPSGKRLYREKQNGFMLEYYQLSLNELETVPALYAYPEKEGPFPTVLYLHSHGGDFSVGKSELIHGAPYLASPSFAEVLTGMGYA
ncbi:MAG: hydrolase, partial [Enterococcus sp.]|nr:hydrolase [Enterococcus sp.]